MSKRILIFILGTAFLSSLLSAAEKRPNILFIFCDDHATQAISAYGGPLAELAPTPNIDRIAREGILFRKCYVTNSICGPSRAVVLTGKYSHLNGFTTNTDTFDGSQETAPKLLRKAGYSTAIVGKWHLKSEPTGFDHFEVLKGQGEYYNPRLRTSGGIAVSEGYVTDIITDHSIDWLESRDPEKPFFLMSQHKAPHGRWEPAIRHLEFLDDVDVPEPVTLLDDYSGRSKAAAQHEMGIAEDMGDYRLMFQYSSKHTPEQKAALDAYFVPRNKAFLEANLEGNDKTRWHYQRYIKNYLRCVKAVDESVGRLLDYLDDNGLSENTIVIYSSDQGFYLGEHGWFDKRWMYEESFRTPLLVRWPGHIEAGSVNRDDIVSNLDFASTFLDVAGASLPEDLQGASLVPVLRGATPQDWRKTHYYHYYESGGHGVPLHFGVTDGRYKLIRFPEAHLDSWELFDIESDPLELESRYDDPALSDIQSGLHSELKRLQSLYEISD
ncbi:sulfatase [Verrucomicrobiales bacterium BCK34]|nr:sulfatase [Verrucomicrobiales bacterium BCK34]